MTLDETLKSLWSRTYQVAVVVRDLDKAVKFYESIGIGPFHEGPSVGVIKRTFKGKPVTDIKNKGVLTQVGQIEFELIQPIAGRSIYSEFLEKKGEGVVHISSYTDDFDRDAAKLTAKGFKMITSGILDDGGKFASFDTSETGGVLFELFQTGPKWT